MRVGTYLSFAAGIAAGACLVSFNPKARQTVCDIKEKAMQKMEDCRQGEEAQQNTSTVN